MKAYILKIDTPVSNQYAQVCAASCKEVGLQWEYFKGFQNMSGRMALSKLGLPTVNEEPYRYIEHPTVHQKAMCCTVGHFAIWKKIAEGTDEVGVVLEHDAIMLHPITIPIPDNEIVVLGYKLTDPKQYDHVSAGGPKDLLILMATKVRTLMP